ncbi:response regulator [Steroidobacter sp. S1-65]|uniref:histidine kinase n=1 Tax=Steroidobacter gossypii TaxID=2805490 RepID=A0ABS1WV23_9GAMM|nr:ATP-binding protein [Steroidobacter gossypii]MBM0104831.1 response regulator [Steroidobacter gossypii]
MNVNSELEAARASLFRGGGELGELMQGMDWQATPLGPPQRWPQSLRSIIRMMLTSRFQMWLGWGPELAFLYNDAYRPTMGVKHPWGLARPASIVWKEIWHDIGPLIEQVMRTGQASYHEAMLLLLERSGFPEETYHTFSYSPLFDDSGDIAGMLCVVVEESERVINDRRLATLRNLSSALATVNTEAALFRQVGLQLGANLHDLPFSLCYVWKDGGARLVAATGIDASHPAAAPEFAVDQAPWPLHELDAASSSLLLHDLATRFESLPKGAWDRSPHQALIVPIPQRGHEVSIAGFFIAGVNPYRQFDQHYRGFIELLAGQIGSALANVRAYEEERRRAEALAELDRAKTNFFSNVSHEFRTPLTLLLGPIEDLLATGRTAEHEIRGKLELAHRNGIRLLRLVNTLLEFSRIEAGRIDASYEPTDLETFSAEIASSFRSAIEQAGMRLRIEAEPLGQPVYVDRDMWEKILLNLLSNAFKFTFEGEIAVSIARSEDGNAARVTVADTGIGVAAEELPKMFDRFHRVAGARGRSFEGSGIGLSLVNELVRLHGGTITAQSTPGKGTAFTIQIPFGRAHLPSAQVQSASSVSAPIKAQPYVEEALRWLPPSSVEMPAEIPLLSNDTDESRAALSGAGKRVLLADDNPDMREYVRRLLQANGYVVEAVENGQKALDAAHVAKPDLVLTDVMMPQLDGFGLLRAIRQDPMLAGVPVVLLSARAGEEAKIEGLDAGADDYMVKPFAARELLARVNSNIQMAMVRREAARAVMQSEQRFLMTRERLELALSTGRVALYDWDVDTDRLSVQGPMAEIFGVAVEDALQGLPLQSFLNGIHPDDRERAAQLVEHTVRTGAPFEAEYRTLGLGRERVVLSRGRMEIKPSGQRFFSGVLIDVTEQKQVEVEMQRLNASLEERVASEVEQRLKTEEALRQAQKMEAIGQLTGGVAHDFNNLLTAIIGGLDTIKRARPEDTARIQRAANMALQGAQRAANLTSRLLAFSRRQPLQPLPIDVNVLVRDMTDLLHRTIGENIELEGVLAPRLWRIETDQNQLEAAILNLAVNARDAMPLGGKLTIETANAALDESYSATDVEVIPGQYVMLSVSDTGFGMSKETLARVFEPFFTTKAPGRGTGLGLSMVYGFVKQSGGHVTIYSEPGQGTSVKLYFPRFIGAENEPEPPVRKIAPGASRGETILVVEDNDEVRGYSTMILTELGYRVLEAAQAETALQLLEGAERLDLLFTDVILPGMNGRALAERAARIHPGLKVLYTTGYSRNAIVHHGRLDPGVQLISKPFTFEQLATRVRDVLDRGR